MLISIYNYYLKLVTIIISIYNYYLKLVTIIIYIYNYYFKMLYNAVDGESKKLSKYAHLESTHHFVPVAVETLGALGPEASSLLKEIARRISLARGEESSRVPPSTSGSGDTEGECGVSTRVYVNFFCVFVCCLFVFGTYIIITLFNFIIFIIIFQFVEFYLLSLLIHFLFFKFINFINNKI